MFSRAVCDLLVGPQGPAAAAAWWWWWWCVVTVERVAQVDLVSQRVAELDPDKLSVPGSLHILLPAALGVGVGFKRKLSPDGVFA